VPPAAAATATAELSGRALTRWPCSRRSPNSIASSRRPALPLCLQLRKLCAHPPVVASCASAPKFPAARPVVTRTDVGGDCGWAEAPAAHRLWPWKRVACVFHLGSARATVDADSESWRTQLRWFGTAAVVGFAVPYFGSSVLDLHHDVYLAIYFASVLALFALRRGDEMELHPTSDSA
jgi:hypothetical protein